MKLLRNMKLLAVAATLGVSLAVPVQAGVIATAILDITNFRFTDGMGNNLDNVNDFTIQSGNNFGSLTADLFSVGGIAAENQDEQLLSASGGQFNGTPQCQGNCFPFADNDYSLRTLPVANTDTYAYSDNNLQGAAIDLDTDGNGTIDVAAGITAQTRADVMLDTTDGGLSTSTTGTNASLTFIANQNLLMQLDFDVSAQALAYVNPATSGAPSSATAGVAWNLVLEDLTAGTIVEYEPAELQLTAARNDFSAQFNPLDNKTFVGSLSTVFNLIAGNSYQLGITHATQANGDKTKVPEPGMLTLMGLGLLSLAVPGIRRRRG